jgi:hypothetical protein
MGTQPADRGGQRSRAKGGPSAGADRLPRMELKSLPDEVEELVQAQLEALFQVR